MDARAEALRKWANVCTVLAVRGEPVPLEALHVLSTVVIETLAVVPDAQFIAGLLASCSDFR